MQRSSAEQASEIERLERQLRIASDVKSTSVADIKTELARACLRAGLIDESIALTQRVLEETNEEHTAALHIYAKLASLRGRGADAVGVAAKGEMIVSDTQVGYP